MKPKYTLNDVVASLKAHQGTRSMTEFAAEVGISLPYLSLIYAGRSIPGPTVLAYLGLRKVTTEPVYEEIA